MDLEPTDLTLTCNWYLEKWKTVIIDWLYHMWYMATGAIIHKRFFEKWKTENWREFIELLYVPMLSYVSLLCYMYCSIYVDILLCLCISRIKNQCKCSSLYIIPVCCCLSFFPFTVFGRPFVKRFALCHQTIVCPVQSDLSVMIVYCGQTVGRIKMKLGIRVGLGPGHIVLDGDPASPP